MPRTEEDTRRSVKSNIKIHLIAMGVELVPLSLLNVFSPERIPYYLAAGAIGGVVSLVGTLADIKTSQKIANSPVRYLSTEKASIYPEQPRAEDYNFFNRNKLDRSLYWSLVFLHGIVFPPFGLFTGLYQLSAARNNLRQYKLGMEIHEAQMRESGL